MKKDPFEAQSCRHCTYWLTDLETVDCPQCGQRHPLLHSRPYRRRLLGRRPLAAAASGCLIGAASAWMCSAMARWQTELWGLPVIAYVAMALGAIGAKTLMPHSRASWLLSAGIFAGFFFSLFYAISPYVPAVLLVATSALIGYFHIRNRLFCQTRKEKTAEQSSQTLAGILDTADERIAAMLEKQKRFKALRRKLSERDTSTQTEVTPVVDETESTLEQAIASYENLKLKTQIQLFHNRIRRLMDTYPKVTKESLPRYERIMEDADKEGKHVERNLEKASYLSESQHAELKHLIERGTSALQRLRSEILKKEVSSETQAVSAIADAGISEGGPLAPTLFTPDINAMDIDTESVCFDSFNDLESEYIRLKSERSIEQAFAMINPAG